MSSAGTRWLYLLTIKVALAVESKLISMQNKFENVFTFLSRKYFKNVIYFFPHATSCIIGHVCRYIEWCSMYILGCSRPEMTAKWNGGKDRWNYQLVVPPWGPSYRVFISKWHKVRYGHRRMLICKRVNRHTLAKANIIGITDLLSNQDLLTPKVFFMSGHVTDMWRFLMTATLQGRVWSKNAETLSVHKESFAESWNLKEVASFRVFTACRYIANNFRKGHFITVTLWSVIGASFPASTWASYTFASNSINGMPKK